jgi:hypothetical protein
VVEVHRLRESDSYNLRGGIQSTTDGDVRQKRALLAFHEKTKRKKICSVLKAIVNKANQYIKGYVQNNTATQYVNYDKLFVTFDEPTEQEEISYPSPQGLYHIGDIRVAGTL